MKTCYECGKLITTKKEVLRVPANYLIALGIDFVKAYHPKCFKKAEKKAELELKTVA